MDIERFREMRKWKKEALVSLHQALPLKVEDIGSIRGGRDDLQKLLNMGKAEVQLGRYEKDDTATPVGKLTIGDIS